MLGGQYRAVGQGFHSVGPLSTSCPSPQPLSPGGIIWPRNHQDACDTLWFLDPAQGLHQAAVGSTKTEGPWLEHRWAWACEFPRSRSSTSQASCRRAHARHPVYSTRGLCVAPHTSSPCLPPPCCCAHLPLPSPCSPLAFSPTHFHRRTFFRELSLALRLGPWSLKSHSPTLLAPSHSQATVCFLVSSPS